MRGREWGANNGTCHYESIRHGDRRTAEGASDAAQPVAIIMVQGDQTARRTRDTHTRRTEVTRGDEGWGGGRGERVANSIPKQKR